PLPARTNEIVPLLPVAPIVPLKLPLLLFAPMVSVTLPVPELLMILPLPFRAPTVCESRPIFRPPFCTVRSLLGERLAPVTRTVVPPAVDWKVMGPEPMMGCAKDAFPLPTTVSTSAPLLLMLPVPKALHVPPRDQAPCSVPPVIVVLPVYVSEPPRV